MNGADVHVDELIPKLNACRQRDLATILELTPARLRMAVALAFADWNMDEWALEAGINKNTIWRWKGGANRIPLGAAYRLARVLGADPLQLFQFEIETRSGPSPVLKPRT